MKIRDLKGLGPSSEKALSEIGISCVDDLKTVGAIQTFIQLENNAMQIGHQKPSLNFLYALEGAIENVSWLTIAKNDKERLLTELDAYREYLKLMNAEN